MNICTFTTLERKGTRWLEFTNSFLKCTPHRLRSGIAEALNTSVPHTVLGSILADFSGTNLQTPEMEGLVCPGLGSNYLRSLRQCAFCHYARRAPTEGIRYKIFKRVE